MKYLKLVCLLLMVCCADANASDYRNIFTYSRYDLEAGYNSETYENTFLARVKDQTSVIFKAYRDIRKSWFNNIFYFGPVINLDQYHYLEVTYGYGKDSDDAKAKYYTLELNCEKPEYWLGAGYKHSDYPDGYDYDLLTVHGKYFFKTDCSLWAKGFLSRDSEKSTDVAIWSEIECRLYPRWRGKAGFTKGERLYSEQFGSSGAGDYYSWLAGFTHEIREHLSIEYTYEAITRDSEYHDTINSLSLDIRF